VDVPSVATAFAGYVPGGVPAGAVFAIVTDAVCPGLRVTDEAEKLVGQPEGWLELRVKLLGEQAAESLFFTDKLKVVLLAG
jgi:hypothetical protein